MSLLDDVSIVVTPNGYKAGELYAVKPTFVLGANLVDDGDFPTPNIEWTISGESTISGGMANIISTAGVNTGVAQTVTMTTGLRYRFQYEVVSNDAGFLKTDNADISTSNLPSTVGVHFIDFINIGNFAINFKRSSGVTDISITNVSVKEYTAADMDVTRATAATRVDEDGLVNYAEVLGGEEVTDGDFSQEGAEKITNGDFSVDSNWSNVGSNGWSIDTGTSTLNFTNASSYVFQGISTVSGKSYKVTLDIELDSGTIVAKSFAAQDVLTVTSTGRQTLIGYFEEGDSNANFGFVASGSASGKIHSVSVKEVGADWDLGTGWSISGGTANCDGTQTGTSSVYQDAGLTIGTTYKATVTISNYSAGNIRILMGGSTYGGWVGTDGETTFVGVQTFDQRIYVQADVNFIGSIDNVSVKEADRDNVPRIDYTGGGCPHILAEPQRTNLIEYSEDFTQWGVGESVVVANQLTSPSGEITADKLNALNATNQQYISVSPTVSSGSVYTLSCFAKKGEVDYIALVGLNPFSQSFFDLNNGTVLGNTATSSSIEDFGNGWYRCTSTFDADTTSKFSGIYLSYDGTSLTNGSNISNGEGVYVYGAQLEEGSYATSYIPNSGTVAGVTRNQDIFTRDGIGSLINSPEGVLFVEMAALADDGTSRDISVSDGTSANYARISLSNAVGNIEYNVVVGSSTKASGVSAITQTNFNKIAVKWKVNDFALWVNGSEVLTDLSGTSFSASTLTTLNFDRGSGTNPLYAKVRQLQVYDTALTDEQLLQLTGESGTDFYESYAAMASALTYTIQ